MHEVATTIRCRTQWGTIDGVEIVVPPGRHAAEDVGLFHQLEIIAADLRTPLPALLAPHRFEVAGGSGFSRLVIAKGVTTAHIQESGLNGVLFTPESPRRTAVLCLSGAHGGYDLTSAGALAAHGYVTFALSYFGLVGQPDDLVEIPLELVGEGLTYLRKLKLIDTVGVAGRSKGGELALLAGAHHPVAAFVVAYVPSSQIQGWGDRPCWTYKGSGLPFVPVDRSRNFLEKGKLVIRPGYESTVESDRDAARTAIEVERIRGSVFLVSGQEDLTWPSTDFCNRIVKRLRETGFEHEVVHLDYPEAGHNVGVPCQPGRTSPDAIFAETRSPHADAVASRHSWNALLDFLDRQ